MKPAAFAYFAPETAEEVLALLAEHGAEARLLAGGQSLVPLINMRLAQPTVLIDLNRCAELDALGDEDGRLALGPMTRQRTLETSPTVRASCPLVAEAMPHVGHASIRNRGTVGGSLSHADPAAELPGVVVALDAELIAEGPNGRRAVPAREFFLAELTTALEADEMLREIRLPKAGDGTRAAFAEIGSHFGGLAIVGVAAQVERDASGTCFKASLAATGAGERPLRLASAEAALAGEVLGPPVIAAAAEAAAADVDPFDDLHATAHWRRRAVIAMVARALGEIASTDDGR
jgi:CO/xanthine dehydrogenase FAD-binding subunit